MKPMFFRGRALTALLILVSFVVLAVSGLVLFFAPGFGIARATGWTLLGLTRRQWENMHTAFALLMMIAAIPHVWMNRKPLLGHIREKLAASANGLRPLRPEVLVAAVLCVFVLAGAVWQIPPVSFITSLRHEPHGAFHPGEPSPNGGGHGWRRLVPEQR